jgi:hypothetical protein
MTYAAWTAAIGAIRSAALLAMALFRLLGRGGLFKLALVLFLLETEVRIARDRETSGAPRRDASGPHPGELGAPRP